MALLQGLSQRGVGEQQAIALPVLVVVVGGWESKGSNGKGTGFLTLVNTAGLFTEAELPPEARGCCQLSSWEHQLGCDLVMPTSVPRGWQIIWRNV